MGATSEDGAVTVAAREPAGVTAAPLVVAIPHAPPATTHPPGVQHAGGRGFGIGRRTFAALRHRDYRLLWLGSTVMSAGQWLQQVTLSWLVFDLTGSAFLLGLINGLRLLPFLFTSLISGVLADRVDRRRMLLITQSYLLLTTLLMAVLLLSGRAAVWHLFAFTFISGLGWSFTMPVRQAILPSLVPRDDLMNAIALSSAAFNFSRVIGPATGGVLLAVLGGGGNFLVQAAAYGVVVILIAAMRVPPVTAAVATRTGASVWQSMVEGLRYVRTNEVVVALLLLSLVPMLLAMPYQSLLPIFADEVYGVGAGGLGLLMSCAGLGSLAATLVVASAGDFGRKGRVQILTLGGLGLMLALFSLSAWLPLAILCLIGVGAFQMTCMTINQTLLQTSIVDEMRGRVSSVYMLDAGLAPAGSFAAGGMAEAIGAPPTVTVMGMLIAGVSALALLRLRVLRDL